MTAAERLIDEILAASRIPSKRGRREVLRELRAHMEDFIGEGRQSGRSDEEIERLLMERFGDPRQIADQFAWVYQRERTLLHLGAFVICTVLVSLIISATTIGIQAGIAFSSGSPVLHILTSRHTAIETLDILASVAVYLGLIYLGRFFRRPFTVLTVVAAALISASALAGFRPRVVLFGFANGALLREIQLTLRHPVVRLAAALACFGMLGAIFFHPSSSRLAATLMSWLIMGSIYHWMALIAVRVDRALLGRM